MKPIATFYPKTRAMWRAWLKKNGGSAREIWLVFYKTHTGRPSVDYDAAVEEALCYGWIDSTIRSLDDESYCRKFTPRHFNSVWSEVNKKRFLKLHEAGKITAAGYKNADMAKVTAPPQQPAPAAALPAPDFMEAGISANPAAWKNFLALAPSHRKNYILWISSAKKEETRNKRIAEAIALLLKNEKLGMK